MTSPHILTLTGALIACFAVNWVLGFVVFGFLGIAVGFGGIYGVYGNLSVIGTGVNGNIGRQKSREFRSNMGALFRVSGDIFTHSGIVHKYATEEMEGKE